MEKRVICTVCPNACVIRAYQDASGQIITEGAKCKQGEKFATEEMINPKRMLTTTVRVQLEGKTMLLPVRSSDLLNRENFKVYMKELARIVVKKEMKLGETIYPDICSTGVDIVAATDTSKICQK